MCMHTPPIHESEQHLPQHVPISVRPYTPSPAPPQLILNMLPQPRKLLRTFARLSPRPPGAALVPTRLLDRRTHIHTQPPEATVRALRVHSRLRQVVKGLGAVGVQEGLQSVYVGLCGVQTLLGPLAIAGSPLILLLLHACESLLPADLALYLCQLSLQISNPAPRIGVLLVVAIRRSRLVRRSRPIIHLSLLMPPSWMHVPWSIVGTSVRMTIHVGGR
mmetsp:Transcript_16712/g.47592  ORF Transcript_16712/g.47592 Transcript_16712/m.47592 type:complete len:219 (-) Transcript_16712:984-1640(-)